MKKRIIFLLIMVFYARLTYSQDYFTVIKISGNIVIERTGSPLGIGTSFAQNENLLFRIPESRAAVINPNRGRFLITSGNLAEFKNSKSNFLPSVGKISKRGPGTALKADELEEGFEGNYVFLNEIKIKIDTAVFPLTDKKFFYIKYEYHNDTINKRLDFIKDTLVIKKNELLTVDGKEITDPDIKKMELFYLEIGKKYVSVPVCTFTPVFPDLKILTREIKIIIDQMKMNTYNEKLNEIYAFIGEFYGKVDANSLKQWLYDNFGLKK